MANKERISCDYQGCDKEFAFRVGPFNICPTHYWDEEKNTAIKALIQQWAVKQKGMQIHGS